MLLALVDKFGVKDRNALEKILREVDNCDWEDSIREYYQKNRPDELLGVWDFDSAKCPIKTYAMGII